MDSGGGTDLPGQGVRRALAHLGTDAASAPDVPAGVTARIGAALRAAPSPAAHAITGTRPRLGRLQTIGLIIGVGAAAAAIINRRFGAASRSAADTDIPRRTDRGPDHGFGRQVARRHAQRRGHTSVIRPTVQAGTPRLTLVFVSVQAERLA